MIGEGEMCLLRNPSPKMSLSPILSIVPKFGQIQRKRHILLFKKLLLVDVRFCEIFINYLVKLNEWIKMLGNCDNLLKLFGSKYENVIYLSKYV